METPQEEFWRGEFGDEYSGRNDDPEIVAGNIALFARMFSGRPAPGSVIELGANIGNNLRALRALFPGQDQHAVEINAAACDRLIARLGADRVVNASMLDWNPSNRWDLVLMKGVLIHINPDRLVDVYDRAASASQRYVAIVEYYNPEPAMVPYRGHGDRLFKRDFCREFLTSQPDYELVDYGFVYRGDPSFPLDDVTWFLLERVAPRS